MFPKDNDHHRRVSRQLLGDAVMAWTLVAPARSTLMASRNRGAAGFLRRPHLSR